MSTTFAEYCEEFFESVISCDDREKMIADTAVRDALLEQYKFVQIRKRLEYQAPQIFDSDNENDANDIEQYLRNSLPSTTALVDALAPFKACRFTLPNPAYRTRYDEIARELFDDFIYPHIGLPLSYITARQVFEEVLIDEDFSSSLARIVAGFGTLLDCSVVRKMVCKMCLYEYKDFNAYSDFIERFPEFFDTLTR